MLVVRISYSDAGGDTVASGTGGDSYDEGG